MKFLKSTFLLSLMVIISMSIMAQSPLQFNYQSVIRDNGGQPVSEQDLTVEIAILQGSAEGQEVFIETHQATTNEFGLVNLQIGSEVSMQGIDWSDDIFFIRVSVDGEIMGTSQLLSVPFALHSQTIANAFSGDYNDLENQPDLSGFIAIEQASEGDLLIFDGQDWLTIPVGAEGQALTIVEGMPQWADLPESDDDGDDPDPDAIIDIDGNVYTSVIINDLEWLAENLRTTRYADGTDIPTGLTDEQWEATSEGAYVVYPHDEVEGINSDEEMIQAYGLLYNWYAVDDSRGLCPAGWRVATHEEFSALTDYFIDNNEEVTSLTVGNLLKSCRQVNSPLGGECATTEHPRWTEDESNYGANEYGFSAVPGGYRLANGSFTHGGGNRLQWWSATEASDNNAYRRQMAYNNGRVISGNYNKHGGQGVRCVKE